VLHVPGSDELALLDIDCASRSACGNQKIGLTTEKRWDLQDIDSFCRNFAMAGFMDISEHGKACRFGEATEKFCPFDQPWAAEAVDRGSVGLIVGSLEDTRYAEVGGNALDRVRHRANVGLALDDAGACDKEQPGFAGDAADGNVGDLEILNHIDYQTTKSKSGVTA